MGRRRTSAPPRFVSGGARVGGKVLRVLLAGVGCAADAEISAGVLPRLAGAVPMETKLGQRLTNLSGGLFLEGNPNPLADDFGETEKVWRTGLQEVQNFFSGQTAVFLPGLGVNREAGVFALRRGLLRRLLNCADLLPSPFVIFL